MKLFSMYGVEERTSEDFEKDLIYRTIAPNVEVAKTKDLKGYRWGSYPNVTLVRLQNKGEVIEMAFHSFAGITEDEEDISIHMYQMESYDEVWRTIRLHKADNSIIAEEYGSIPCCKYPPDDESRNMMLEDWELQYGARKEWKL